MSTQTKKTWKIVGLVAGSLLLLGGVVVFFVWQKRNKDQEIEDENPYVGKRSSGGGSSSPSVSTGSSSPTTYSKEEIKKMQGWLLSRGIFHFNSTVINAIQGTGGIDGVIGSGFNRALNEAISKGWVMGIQDLYNKAISN